MKAKIFVPFVIMFIFYLQSYAQDSIATIHVIHKVEKDKIILRWAPSTAGAWHMSSKYGYKIERIVNKYEASEMNESKIIYSKLLPWEKSKWTKEDASTYDDYCIIAAELLYGNKSETEKSGKILDKADAFKNRYTYAMMAADFSAQASEALGLRYEDNDVQPGYTYIYTITSLTPQANYKINSGTTIAYSSQIDTLDKPQFHHIESGDSVLHLIWEKDQSKFRFNYTAYFLEKTEDQKTFKRVNDKPYISSNQYGEQFNQYHIYSDSLDKNYKYYGYRLIGISPFAELSPPSEVVYGAGRDLTPPLKVQTIKSLQLSDKTNQIVWEYPDQITPEIKGFLIGRSKHPLDSFYNITPIMLPPNTRKFIDKEPLLNSANFYIVTVLDTAGNFSISNSHYVHMVDSVAPSIPKNLKGVAYKNGCVILTWDQNPEADILGYTLHYSNHPDHVFAAITNKPVIGNTYHDTVMVRTLSEKLYYKIVAFDKSHNHSSFSEMIEVEIPDIVQPAVALVKDFEVKNDAIKIFWINSTSDDVLKHELYRKDSLNGEWMKIFETTNSKIISYEDKNIKPLYKYFYKVHAVDDANLRSEESTIIEAISASLKLSGDDLNLKAIVANNKIIITWNAIDHAKSYTLYKSNINGSFTTLINTSETSYQDLPDDLNAKYTIRIIAKNGITQDFSKPISIVKI